MTTQLDIARARKEIIELLSRVNAPDPDRGAEAILRMLMRQGWRRFESLTDHDDDTVRATPESRITGLTRARRAISESKHAAAEAPSQNGHQASGS